MTVDVLDLVRMFEQSEQMTYDARVLSERDRDYYDGKQLTDDEIRVLSKRKQPIVVYNRIQRKVNYLSGLEKQSRKDPKAFPRNPDDEDAANAATDALRFVCDRQKWDKKRSAAWKNLLVEGTAAVLVEVEKIKDGYDPKLTRIPWDRFFFDPKSSELDFSDARYMGIVTWYDLDEAKAKGWDESVLEATLVGARADGTYEDKPKYQTWSDPKNKRVRVCEIYHRYENQWWRCVFTGRGHLEEPALSPYLDDQGEPENPIKAASIYVDRDNNRYGEVRVLISPQDEINKRRSKSLHFATMRQVRVGRASSADAEKIRRELAKPDGIIVAEREDFEVLRTSDLEMANFNMLQEAKNEIDLLGANAALQGKNEVTMSGRALLAQQQGGMVEVADPFDVLRDLTLRVYEAIWNRIRQVWTGERWIRVTDDAKNVRFVGLNEQVTVKQIAEEVAKGDPKGIQSAIKIVGPQVMQAYLTQPPPMPQQGDMSPEAQQALQANQMHQQAQMALGLFVQQNGDKVAEVRNAVNELDVDIIMEEGVDTPTVQAEQFDTLAKIIPGIINLPPEYAKLLVMSSQLRDKDKMLEMFDEKMQGPPPEQQQMVQQAQQLQLMEMQAKIKKLESEAMRNMTAAQGPGRAEAPDPMETAIQVHDQQIKAYNAVTDRMQAMQPA